MKDDVHEVIHSDPVRRNDDKGSQTSVGFRGLGRFGRAANKAIDFHWG